MRCGKHEPQYGYEYMGSPSMLVITPLSQAAYAHFIASKCERRGASAQGPAGTGKTESIKDTAILLGIKPFVINCTEHQDFAAYKVIDAA